MIIDLGHFALGMAWLMSIIAIVSGGYGGAKRILRWQETAARATVLVCVFCTVAIGCLAVSFLNDDYSVQYVWQFSNRDMLPIYKISAIWGGMDGSMLLWAFILSISGALVAAGLNRYPDKLGSWTIAVFNTSSLFFLSVVLFFTNPFRYIHAGFIPPDGNGLNPLLQNPLMAIHPPMLYLGFTTFSVPYAFCLGALLSGSINNEWIRLTRRWTLIAWTFLTVGICLGGFWAYVELGWGGFWAWDPVENASFFPWLSATAYVHSVMVQERKNMLRFWNVWLVVLTYALTVFGTFLTRSGVVQSVHAFASTDIGGVFLGYLVIVFCVTGILIYRRRLELRAERRIESMLSREAAFLINNLLLLSILFATVWGVLFPVLSEALTGKKQAVSVPYFNAVNLPLFLALLFLMGVGPLIAWRKASLASLRRLFIRPFLFSCGVGVLLVWAGVTSFLPLLSYCLCFFVVLSLISEVYRAYRTQTGALGEKANVVSGVGTLVRRHRSRYGGYLVHFGVIVMTIGITASMAHKVEREFSLAPGERFEVGRFAFVLNKIYGAQEKSYEALRAEISLRSLKGDEELTVLNPELRSYYRNNETTTEVALRVGPREDVYLVLAGLDANGDRATLKLFINPLQMWLWVGVGLVLCGSIVILWPKRGLAFAAGSVRSGVPATPINTTNA